MVSLPLFSKETQRQDREKERKRGRERKIERPEKVMERDVIHGGGGERS